MILLEGACSAHPELADLVDLAILVDVPVGERHVRLEAREDGDFLEKWHKRRIRSKAITSLKLDRRALSISL